MYATKLYALLLVLLVGFFLPSSYANIVYSEPHSTPPVDKEKPLKKPKKQRTRSWKTSFQPNTITHLQQASEEQDAGVVFSSIFAVLAILAPPTLFILGILLGGVGWFIAGSIVTGLWLVLAFVFMGDSYLSSVSFIIFAVLTVLFLGFLIWALIAAFPLLLTLSIIFGGLSLIGLFLFLVLQNY